jgi:hypothetical protein
MGIEASQTTAQLSSEELYKKYVYLKHAALDPAVAVDWVEAAKAFASRDAHEIANAIKSAHPALASIDANEIAKDIKDIILLGQLQSLPEHGYQTFGNNLFKEVVAKLSDGFYPYREGNYNNFIQNNMNKLRVKVAERIKSVNFDQLNLG